MLNTRTYIYKVADCPFLVNLPADVNADRLLPSLASFRQEAAGEGRWTFRFFASSALMQWDDEGEVVEESCTDLGQVCLLRTAQGYRVDLRYVAGGSQHTLHFDEGLTLAVAHVCWDDPYVGEAISSMLRIVCSQAVLAQGGVAIHASSVALEGKAYLFLGSSGTGKSTHAALWTRLFEGCQLLNDDNPFLRLDGGGVRVYGTPWSGKTPCYRNLSYPVEAIVRLRQASANRFTPYDEASAFMALMPSCSAIRTDEALTAALYDTLQAVAARVTMARLDCLPDEESARLNLARLRQLQRRNNNSTI